MNVNVLQALMRFRRGRATRLMSESQHEIFTDYINLVLLIDFLTKG